MSDNMVITVKCVNTLCESYDIQYDVEPWASTMCSCGSWTRTPDEVAVFMEDKPEYWEKYMGLCVSFPGISEEPA